MKLMKKLSLLACMSLVITLLVACGGATEKIVLGTYNSTNSTFTALDTEDSYSIQVEGNIITLKGTIPYSSSVLGIKAGNIVALKLSPMQTYAADDETYVKTSNKDAESGWNTYDKSVIEEDGSVIWLTSVNKENDVQIKIKWNKDAKEVTYTLKVASDATLQTA